MRSPRPAPTTWCCATGDGGGAAASILLVSPRSPSSSLFIAWLALLATACSAPRWRGDVERWGSLREVLRDGKKQGRVVVTSMLTPDAVGLGALADLEGEVAVLDGAARVGRADAERAGNEPATAKDQAAFLVLARVPTWRTTLLDADLSIDALDPRAFGAADARTIPFLVHGEFADLEMHVLRGRCPYAEDDTAGEPPLRMTRPRAQGTLVGFWTSEPPGVLTHHDSVVHVHVVLTGPDGVVAHVDRVRVLAGAKVSVPE